MRRQSFAAQVAKSSSVKQQRQQRQRQRRLKHDLIFNPRILREFRFIQFVYTVRNIPNRICETASKLKKKIGCRIVHVLSNMQNMAISRCFVTFGKQRQRNEQRITTHAYTAIILVAVAAKVCLIKLPKTYQINGQIMNSQTSTKLTKARPNKKTAESAENISAVKRNQNTYNDVPAISYQVVARKSLRLSTHRASNILGSPGYHV